jgi:hypothetical protein
MAQRIFVVFSLLVLLSACAPAARQASPTLPGPTQPAPTNTIPLPLPSQTLTLGVPSTPSLIPPTETVPGVTPTIDLAPEPTWPETAIPLPTPIPHTTAEATPIPQPSGNSATIQMYGPGPNSKIVSPLDVYGYAVPGYQHKGNVALYGEDGRVLASEMLQLNTAYKWAYFYWSLDFNVSAAGELGRLSMSTQDQYGRTTAVNSIHVFLLPEGESILSPPGDLDLMERCVINEPAAGQKPSGGMLTVAGTYLPFNNLPLSISLIDRDGWVLNSQLVSISPAGSTPVDFRIDIPYSILKGTYALLSVSQYDDRIGGVMYLYSQEIFLSP